MRAKFRYEDKELMIQFNPEETAEEVCNHFVNKTFLNINDLYFKYGEKILTPEQPIDQQLDLPENTTEIEILVKKKDPEKEHLVQVDVDGVQENVVVEKGGAVLDKIEKLFNFLKKPFKRFNFFYNGSAFGENERRKTFNQLANKEHKKQNVMKVIAVGGEEPLEDEQINENKVDDNKIDENKEEEVGEKSKPLLEEIDEGISLIDAWKFFIKLYSFLLFQFILIGVFAFLGFYFDFDDCFSNSSKAFWWTVSTISIFALFGSLVPFCLVDTGNGGSCAYFLWFIYIPIITIYCYLLKRNKGTDIIEGFYIIYQIIIFGLDFLFLIIVNAIFKRYRGWLNFLVLSGVNILTIYVYSGPLSENYENLKMSHNGFINLSVISSVMIAFIIMINPLLASMKNEENETGSALIGALFFISIPFTLALILIVAAILLGLLLGILALFLGIALAFACIVVALFILFLFLSGLA